METMLSLVHKVLSTLGINYLIRCLELKKFEMIYILDNLKKVTKGSTSFHIMLKVLARIVFRGVFRTLPNI